MSTEKMPIAEAIEHLREWIERTRSWQLQKEGVVEDSLEIESVERLVEYVEGIQNAK